MADEGERYCPICEGRMYESTCPEDGIQTVPYAAIQSSTAQLSPNTVVDGRYRIDALLGSGAMGTVYAATQTRMDRRVALKVLVRQLLRNGGDELKRFWREAKNASRIKHPNVVRVYDFGVDDHLQLPFLAMELVEGRTLRTVLAEEGPLPLVRAAELLEQVARALMAAHELQIVHRDLKPDNMMVGRLAGGEEHVTVLDFGIAKAIKAPGALHESLTASGVVVGTPRYMSPEQIRGQSVDPRSDLYGLGCILHEAVTGEPPYTATDPVALMMKHVDGVLPTLPRLSEDPATQAAISHLHQALLQKDPEQRPVSAGQVAKLLRKVARGQPMPPLPGFLLSPDPGPDSGLAASSDAPFQQTEPTDTHVRSRPIPTPVDSQAFSDLGLDSAAMERPEPSPRPNRGRSILISGAAVAAVLLFLGGGLWTSFQEPQPGTQQKEARGASGAMTGAEAVPQVQAPAPAQPPESTNAAGDPRTPRQDAMGQPSGEAPAPHHELSPEPVLHPTPVRITFSGRPKQAMVMDARGNLVCRKLPCTVKLDRSKRRERFRIEAPNHYPKSVTITPNRDRRTSVKLLPKLAPPTY